MAAGDGGADGTYHGGGGDDGSDGMRAVLAGAEAPHNRATVHVASKAGAIAAAVLVVACRTNRAYGVLTNVATVGDHRGHGLAAGLCGRAAARFRAEGGEVLMLATHNPAAARVYARLGFRCLPGTNCWYCNVADARSPEDWVRLAT